MFSSLRLSRLFLLQPLSALHLSVTFLVLDLGFQSLSLKVNVRLSQSASKALPEAGVTEFSGESEGLPPSAAADSASPPTADNDINVGFELPADSQGPVGTSHIKALETESESGRDESELSLSAKSGTRSTSSTLSTKCTSFRRLFNRRFSGRLTRIACSCFLLNTILLGILIYFLNFSGNFGNGGGFLNNAPLGSDSGPDFGLLIVLLWLCNLVFLLPLIDCGKQDSSCPRCLAKPSEWVNENFFWKEWSRPEFTPSNVFVCGPALVVYVCAGVSLLVVLLSGTLCWGHGAEYYLDHLGADPSAHPAEFILLTAEEWGPILRAIPHNDRLGDTNNPKPLLDSEGARGEEDSAAYENALEILRTADSQEYLTLQDLFPGGHDDIVQRRLRHRIGKRLFFNTHLKDGSGALSVGPLPPQFSDEFFKETFKKLADTHHGGRLELWRMKEDALFRRETMERLQEMGLRLRIEEDSISGI